MLIQHVERKQHDIKAYNISVSLFVSTVFTFKEDTTSPTAALIDEAGGGFWVQNWFPSMAYNQLQ